MLEIGTKVKVIGHRPSSSHVARIHNNDEGVVVIDTDVFLTPEALKVTSLVAFDGVGVAYIPDRDLEVTGKI